MRGNRLRGFRRAAGEIERGMVNQRRHLLKHAGATARITSTMEEQIRLPRIGSASCNRFNVA
jgi:hypothetical protein